MFKILNNSSICKRQIKRIGRIVCKAGGTRHSISVQIQLIDAVATIQRVHSAIRVDADSIVSLSSKDCIVSIAPLNSVIP